MLRTLAVSGYRSLRDVVVPLQQLTVVTGANGTGKTSLYRSLRLLSDAGQGRLIGALAREGGLQSALWAGPENLAAARRGEQVTGTRRRGPISVQWGCLEDDLGYLMDLGLPIAHRSAFDHDPQIKREVVFAAPVLRRGSVLCERRGSVVTAAAQEATAGSVHLTQNLPSDLSMLSENADSQRSPELVEWRERVRGWRFYDGFRVDRDSPVRAPQIGTRSYALADDGSDLAACLQTILEDDEGPLAAAIDRAFPGSRVMIEGQRGSFDTQLRQPGMLRPLRAAELSDGTLRYLLWCAALLTPRPPRLLVVNEPENSLHPDLVPALGELIRTAAERTQVVVISHDAHLVRQLKSAHQVRLESQHGETVVADQGVLDRPRWEWGQR